MHMKILSFKQWDEQPLINEDEATNSQQQQPNNDGPKSQWEQLINDHRVKFTSKFQENQLTIDDQQFVTTFFEKFKYSKQKPVGNIFETKIRAVTFQLAYFGKQRWCGCIITPQSREVTELFTVTETKIKSLFDLFDKAIKQQSFKNILPVKTK